MVRACCHGVQHGVKVINRKFDFYYFLKNHQFLTTFKVFAKILIDVANKLSFFPKNKDQTECNEYNITAVTSIIDLTC